jgi:hypothetical protein
MEKAPDVFWLRMEAPARDFGTLNYAATPLALAAQDALGRSLQHPTQRLPFILAGPPAAVCDSG